MSYYQSAERIPDPSWKYDVFLSFRGNDTRFGFTSHLYAAIKNAGIHAFIDDEELQKGDMITYTMVQAIEASRVAIVVFSQDYAASKWCLDELTKIMECRSTIGQTVIPVFYNVGPADVLNQTGPVNEAFQRHIKRFSEEKVNAWRTALTEAANLQGFEITRHRNEAEIIGKIVKHVTSVLDSKELYITEHPVGVESRMEDVIQLLHSHTTDDVVLIGIWGMGGVGKTTIAKTVYNKIRRHFDSAMFLPNIRGRWENNKQVSLQEELLNRICNAGMNIKNIASGVALLRESLRLKRVFIVLDDVNNIEQLNSLCGSREWFGPGSTIIITTRDRRLLRKIEVDHVYHVREMNDHESLKLFRRNAFGQETPLEEFARLAEEVVAYCGGLPLALVTIGRELFGKMKDEWENVLGRLKRCPHPDIHKVLKISFDGLNDDRQKEIFLEIASFCIGMKTEDVMQILKGAFGISEDGISFLEEQSLIAIDDQDIVRMHPLLRGMGLEIVREQSQTEAQEWKYDIFLSFRGKDTRPGFTSHLTSSLQNAAFTVFKDDDVDGLQRGERISIALLKAIGLSQCAVIVLSTNYADSKWCLQELENIMVCHRTKGQKVFPIFYGVDHLDVRYQTETSDFGRAFKSLIEGKRPVEKDKVQRWTTALVDVSNLSGRTMTKTRDESEDIKKIVEDVTRVIDKTEMLIADYPVGIASRLQKVIEESNIKQTKDGMILGIEGMGGMGKTTIAKAIYNRVGRDFEARSFLQDIREKWQQIDGKVSLQKQLLKDIFRETRRDIPNIDSGKQILKDKLRGKKKVLIVLDDVNDSEQLNALCGSGEWCGLGSIVIITTRNNNLLRVCKHTFSIEELDPAESLELFSWHAFKKARPEEKFEELSEDVVEYCKGLPLALVVLGSHLLNTGTEQWQIALGSLKSIPPDDVQKKLRISFDGLYNNSHKIIFLHIVCFFIGMDRNEVIQILDGCGIDHAEFGISVLKDRNLITVDNNNMLGMHDLLSDMGRGIICDESPLLKDRSRLWYDQKVLQLLESYTRKKRKLKEVIGLSLKLPTTTKSFDFIEETFEVMPSLTLLQLASVEFKGEFKHLSGDLIWMSWHGFPMRHTPKNCYQPCTISIELQNSKLRVLWKEAPREPIKNLKMLNLSHSHDLRRTPDFSYLPDLEKLVLKDCTSLSEISPTIGSLKKILHINLEGCTKLDELPRSIYKLKSLETLIISGCSKIDKLEEDVEQMESLKVLKADNTAIVQVAVPIKALTRLPNLVYISVAGYEGKAHDVICLIINSSLWTSPTKVLSSPMQNRSLGSSSTLITHANCAPLQTKGDVSLDTDNVANCNELGITKILQKTVSQKLSTNNEHYNFNGASVTFNALHVNGCDLKLKTMSRCIVYSSTDTLASLEDDKWQTIISNMGPRNRVEISIPVCWDKVCCNEEMDNSYIRDALSEMIYQYAIAQNDGTIVMELTKDEKLVYAFRNHLIRAEAATAKPSSWIGNNVGFPLQGRDILNVFGVKNKAADKNVTHLDCYTQEDDESATKQIEKWFGRGDINSKNKKKFSSSNICFVKPVPKIKEFNPIRTFKPKSKGFIPSTQTFLTVVPSASILNFEEESRNSGYKSTTENQEHQHLQEIPFDQREDDVEPDRVEENNEIQWGGSTPAPRRNPSRSQKPKCTSEIESEASEKEVDQPLPRLSDLSHSQASSNSLQITGEDIPTMIQPNNSVLTTGVNLPLESDLDLDFDIDTLILKAQQVYSSDGTKMISSELHDSTVAAVKPSPRETTPPKRTLPTQLIEKVNEVLLCLNHSLEDIAADSTFKDRLLSATDFFGSSTSSLPDPTTHASLEKFVEEVYSILPTLKESQQAHSQSLQALADHDIQLKKYDDAKSRLSDVLSDGKSKEKELDGKISLLEQELAKLRQFRQTVTDHNSILAVNIQKVEKAYAVKSMARTSLAHSVEITKLAKETAEQSLQRLGQRHEDLKLQLRHMLL